MDLFNIEVKGVDKQIVEAVHVSDPYEEAKKSGMQLIQWLPAKHGIHGEIVMPDATRVEGLFEENIAYEKTGQVVQLVRFGFARIDETAPSHVVAYFAHS